MTDAATGDELDGLIHEATKDPVVAAAFEAAEARRKEAAICPQCLHGWHGRRVCRDANCCSCRLTWRDAWKAGYMQGWRDYPSALWRGFYPPTEVEMESDTTTALPPVDAVVEVAFRGRVAAYNDDYNGTVSVEVLADDGRSLGYYANVPREAVWIADEHAPDVRSDATDVLTKAWQAVDRAVRPLGYGDGATNSPWNQGYEQAKNEALNAILAVRDGT